MLLLTTLNMCLGNISERILLTTTNKVCLIPSVKLLKGASRKTPFNNDPETEKKQIHWKKFMF